MVKRDDVAASEKNFHKLTTFCGIFSKAECQKSLFGNQLPDATSYYIVEVTREGSSNPELYICIQGLGNDNEIGRFHSVMSTKRYRRIYWPPLKLCYEISALKRAGTKMDVYLSSINRLDLILRDKYIFYLANHRGSRRPVGREYAWPDGKN
jgi:hypothetical protein